MKLVREITFDFAVVQLFEPRYIRIEFFAKKKIDGEACRAVIEALGDLCGHKMVLVMTVAAESTLFTAEAREESASENGLKYTLADAFVARNLAQRLMVNFYLKINKPVKPSMAFPTEEDALNWLFSYKWNSKS